MKDTITLKDIMTSNNLTVIKPNTTFEKVKEIFRDHSFHHLPVVDEMNRVCGMVGKRDFNQMAYYLSTQTTGKTYSEKVYNSTTAKDIMSNDPVFLNPYDSLELAATLFLENTYHALPVMEDGVLIGIVTNHDLLKYAFKNGCFGVNKLM